MEKNRNPNTDSVGSSAGGTQTKTFKNVEVVPYAAGQWGVRELNGSTHGFFPAHEWDMEVTFTKKNKVINIADQVDFYDDEGYPWQGKVIWFDEKHALISQNWGAPKVVKREHIGL